MQKHGCGDVDARLCRSIAKAYEETASSATTDEKQQREERAAYWQEKWREVEVRFYTHTHTHTQRSLFDLAYLEEGTHTLSANTKPYLIYK